MKTYDIFIEAKINPYTSKSLIVETVKADSLEEARDEAFYVLRSVSYTLGSRVKLLSVHRANK